MKRVANNLVRRASTSAALYYQSHSIPRSLCSTGRVGTFDHNLRSRSRKLAAAQLDGANAVQAETPIEILKIACKVAKCNAIQIVYERRLESAAAYTRR